MSIDADLELLLRRTNPWLWDPTTWVRHWQERQPEPYIPRSPRGWDRELPTTRVTLVIGPRRAGKTTLLWRRVSELGPALLHVNCEEPLFRSWCTSPARFAGDLAEVLPKPRALMFDEVQHLTDAGLFLKGLVDLRLGVPILATGSSAFHLQARTRESLAGRAVRLRLLPFSLQEVIPDDADAAPLVHRGRRREAMERMLVEGSYPEVWLGSEPDRMLSELVEGVVVRDASDLFRIDHPEAFRRLLRLMASQVGSLVNVAEWSSICGISARTVQRYASILEEAHVVALVRPFVSGKRAEITGSPKVFFHDNGIRNAVLGRLSPLDRRGDVGGLWENWVFSEIAKAVHPLLDSVGHWRTRSGAEVDFVVQVGDRLIAVEAKTGAVGRPRLSRGARSFITAVHPDRFLLAHSGPRHEARVDGCPVLWTEPAEVVSLLRDTS